MAAKKHTIAHYLVTVIYYTLRSGVGAFFSIIIALFGVYLYRNLLSPFNLLIAVPLVLGGGGYAINKIFSILSSIFSPKFNRGVCIICSPGSHET